MHISFFVVPLHTKSGIIFVATWVISLFSWNCFDMIVEFDTKIMNSLLFVGKTLLVIEWFIRWSRWPGWCNSIDCLVCYSQPKILHWKKKKWGKKYDAQHILHTTYMPCMEVHVSGVCIGVFVVMHKRGVSLCLGNISCGGKGETRCAQHQSRLHWKWEWLFPMTRLEQTILLYRFGSINVWVWCACDANACIRKLCDLACALCLIVCVKVHGYQMFLTHSPIHTTRI